MNKRWVLVDVSYLAHRALHSVGHLRTEGIGPTGVLFGFFTQLREICQDLRVSSNRVVMCFDSDTSHRADQYPFYKEKRRPEKGEQEAENLSMLHDQIRLLREKILPDMGVSCLLQDGLESDDLLAAAADWIFFVNEDPEQDGVIITSDSDLWQAMNYYVTWFDPMRNRFYDIHRFKKEKGIPAWWWWKVKAMAGDSSDSIPGIPRVGVKTAVRYLLGELPKHHQTFQAIESEEGKRIVKRNEELIHLPHHKTEPIELVDPQWDPDVFFHYCEEYGLSMFLNKQRKHWEQFLKGSWWRPRTPNK